jgi:hypothetical protein
MVCRYRILCRECWCSNWVHQILSLATISIVESFIKLTSFPFLPSSAPNRETLQFNETKEEENAFTGNRTRAHIYILPLNYECLMFFVVDYACLLACCDNQLINLFFSFFLLSSQQVVKTNLFNSTDVRNRHDEYPSQTAAVDMLDNY